jgi:hypothetical protein
LVEADGGPLAVVVAGANVPDAQLLTATIAAVILERPPVDDGWSEQHLCLDKGYDNPTGWRVWLASAMNVHPDRSATRRGAGWWSGHWGGSPSAAPC